MRYEWVEIRPYIGVFLCVFNTLRDRMGERSGYPITVIYHEQTQNFAPPFDKGSAMTKYFDEDEILGAFSSRIGTSRTRRNLKPAFPKYRRYSVRREGDSAIRIMKL